MSAAFFPGDIRYNHADDDFCLWRKTSFAFHLINLPLSSEECVNDWKQISKDSADPPRKRKRQISSAFY